MWHILQYFKFGTWLTIFKLETYCVDMVRHIKISKKLKMFGLLDTPNALFAISQKCDKWPGSFAKVVKNVNIA